MANWWARFQRREFGGLSGGTALEACVHGRPPVGVVAATLNPPPDIDRARWQAVARRRA